MCTPHRGPPMRVIRSRLCRGLPGMGGTFLRIWLTRVVRWDLGPDTGGTPTTDVLPAHRPVGPPAPPRFGYPRGACRSAGRAGTGPRRRCRGRWISRSRCSMRTAARSRRSSAGPRCSSRRNTPTRWPASPGIGSCPAATPGVAERPATAPRRVEAPGPTEGPHHTRRESPVGTRARRDCSTKSSRQVRVA